MVRARLHATACAALALAVPVLARAEVVNPGVIIGGYLLSPWGIAAALILGWPAVQLATGRPWRRSVWLTLAVKAPSALVGPFLLLLTGGLVVSFAPLALAANVVVATALYALLDLTALRVALKARPTRRAVVALFAANLVLVAAAMIVFVTVDRDLWLRIRSAR